MTANARVEIVSSPRPVHVDRTLPSVLQDHLKLQDWECFCEDVDNALQPLDMSIEVCQIIVMGGFTLGLIGILGTFFMLQIMTEQAIMFLIAAVVFFSTANCVVALFLRHKFDQTNAALESICHAMSNRCATSLSFHLRSSPVNFTRRGGGMEQALSNMYIEVCVRYNPPQSRRPSNTMRVPTFDKDDIHHNSTVVQSIKERLESLEQIRNVLSEAEYREKRSEILDAV